jgi:hypothetical protein
VPWAFTPGFISQLKLIKAIPGTDRRQEAAAKAVYEQAISALTELVEFADSLGPRPPPRGWAQLAHMLVGELTPYGFDTLRGKLHQLAQRSPTYVDPFPSQDEPRAPRLLETFTTVDDGWTALKHFAQEVGRPWRAPERTPPFRFEVGGAWRRDGQHELTLDELVALAVLAGHFDKVRAQSAIGQATRHGVAAKGASLADAVDVLRKPLRKHLESLTRVPT